MNKSLFDKIIDYGPVTYRKKSRKGIVRDACGAYRLS